MATWGKLEQHQLPVLCCWQRASRRVSLFGVAVAGRSHKKWRVCWWQNLACAGLLVAMSAMAANNAASTPPTSLSRSLLQAPAANCNPFCPAKTQTWEGKCAWSGCSGCPECSVPPPPSPPMPPPNLSPVAICRGYCYTKTDAWEQRCAWGGCGGCAECLIPPPSPPPLPPPAGCTVALAVNYDPLAVADDGSCVFGPGPDVEVPVQTSTSEGLFVRPRCDDLTGRTLATGGRCDLLPGYPILRATAPAFT